jgi:plastocyanin
MKTTKTAWALVALLAMAVAAGCSRSEETKTEATPAPAAAGPVTTVDPATAATVTGVVNYEGQPPRQARIDMSQDPGCKPAGTVTADTVVVENGKLANVFVYVKEGLGDARFAAPQEAAVIDQEGCIYHPRVLGVMANQTVRILNSDPTTHNVHPTPKNNREWNESQPPKGAALEKTFPREEIMMPVKCNQHPWMKMYVNVVRHPFHAVTGKDGSFELKGLPPGEYTIAAVHERYGEVTQQVTVGASESKSVEFQYSASMPTTGAGQP